MAVDVTEPEAPQRLVDPAVDRFGSLDIVVANAGGPPPGRALEVDDDALTAAVEANLLTSVRLVRAAVPHHAPSGGWGRHLLASPRTRSSSPSRPLPCPTRPGPACGRGPRRRPTTWPTTETGITLNLACPGSHATERMRQLGGGNLTGAHDGDPADFGKVVTFLCSEPAAFVNGAAVVVDGGATLAL